MKAYQVKITVKNSKPPVWRRCIIPAGITFSSMSTALNQIMGWSGKKKSDFEFYHKKLQLVEENVEELSAAAGDKREVKDAGITYIDEYMESEKWFTYTYDTDASYQHRVDIEEVLTEYEYDYPQVIKYRGDCLAEDSGEPEMYSMVDTNEKLKGFSKSKEEEKAAEAVVQAAEMAAEASKKPATPKYSNRQLLNNRSNFSGANMPVKKNSKVYPNDPCPCGSGRKYKQCCRNK